MSEQTADLGAEDAKLVTLARATRARAQASEGAAVRDLDGRTYAAASVRLEHLSLSALEVCVAMALSSGSTGLEAAVVLTDGDQPDLAAAGVRGTRRTRARRRPAREHPHASGHRVRLTRLGRCVRAGERAITSLDEHAGSPVQRAGRAT